jgi:hypothetical protein
MSVVFKGCRFSGSLGSLLDNELAHVVEPTRDVVPILRFRFGVCLVVMIVLRIEML